MTIHDMEKSTTPISLRINNAHLATLEKIAQRLGLQRSATIQLAIAQFIQREKK